MWNYQQKAENRCFFGEKWTTTCENGLKSVENSLEKDKK